MTVRQNALVIGDGEPATAIALGLADLGWSVVQLHDGSSPITDHNWPDELDLVVHARYPAACRQQCAMADLSPAEWHAACDEPLTAAIRVARLAYRPLLRRAGRIVFVVPLMASAGGAGYAPFAAAAEGCRILAKSLARSWGSDGIGSHALTLDPSAFVHGAANSGGEYVLHDPPLGRVPDPRIEVSAMINALTDESFDVLVGSSLVLDGGSWMPG